MATMKAAQRLGLGSGIDSEDMLKLSAQSDVRPMIEQYPLEKAAEAYQ